MEGSKLTSLSMRLYENRYRALFVLTVLAYIAIYAPFGFTEGDDGFITALSWRIYNGQLPYIDFIYVRPPLTLFLHTLPFLILPQEIVVFSERVLFYVSLAVGSYFGSKSVLVVIEESFGRIDTYLLSILVFIYSVNSFTPMAWHSIDGVLFGSIGVYFILTGRTWVYTGVGLLFLSLAALTKQSFYPLPFAAIVYIFLSTRSSKKSGFSFALLVLYAGGFYAFMSFTGMWTEFVAQTTSETTFRDAYTVGVYAYLHSSVLYFAIPLIIYLILNHFRQLKWCQILMTYTPLVVVFFAFAYSTAFYLNRLFFKEMSYHDYLQLEYGDPVPTVLFIWAVIYLAANAGNKRLFAGLGLMLSLSWCGAISWAHHSPHLYSAPWIIIPVIAGVQYFGTKTPDRLIWGLIALGLVVYYLAYLKPFNSEIRSKMDYDLGNVVPELSRINGDQRIYSQLQELSVLFKRYAKPSAVLPAMPMADLFYKQPFPLPIDWPMNCEIASKHKQVLAAIGDNCYYIFINREWLDEEKKWNNENRKFSSKVTVFVSKNWQLVDNTGAYLIYKNPKK